MFEYATVRFSFLFCYSRTCDLPSPVRRAWLPLTACPVGVGAGCGLICHRPAATEYKTVLVPRRYHHPTSRLSFPRTHSLLLAPTSGVDATVTPVPPRPPIAEMPHPDVSGQPAPLVRGRCRTPSSFFSSSPVSPHTTPVEAPAIVSPQSASSPASLYKRYRH
jgi:hypothetical protein